MEPAASPAVHVGTAVVDSSRNAVPRTSADQHQNAADAYTPEIPGHLYRNAELSALAVDESTPKETAQDFCEQYQAQEQVRLLQQFRELRDLQKLQQQTLMQQQEQQWAILRHKQQHIQQMSTRHRQRQWGGPEVKLDGVILDPLMRSPSKDHTTSDSEKMSPSRQNFRILEPKAELPKSVFYNTAENTKESMKSPGLTNGLLPETACMVNHAGHSSPMKFQQFDIPLATTSTKLDSMSKPRSRKNEEQNGRTELDCTQQQVESVEDSPCNVLPADRPIKPGINGQKTFEQLLEEQLEKSELQHVMVTNPTNTCKPFLRKGQGIARFRVKSDKKLITSKKICQSSQPSRRSTSQISRQPNRMSSHQTLHKPKVPTSSSATATSKPVSYPAPQKLKLKPLPATRQPTSNLFTSSSSQVAKSPVKSSNIAASVPWSLESNLLHLEKLRDQTQSEEFEEKELQEFELMEECADNISFASNSSLVVNFIKRVPIPPEKVLQNTGGFCSLPSGNKKGLPDKEASDLAHQSLPICADPAEADLEKDDATLVGSSSSGESSEFSFESDDDDDSFIEKTEQTDHQIQQNAADKQLMAKQATKLTFKAQNELLLENSLQPISIMGSQDLSPSLVSSHQEENNNNQQKVTAPRIITRKIAMKEDRPRPEVSIKSPRHSFKKSIGQSPRDQTAMLTNQAVNQQDSNADRPEPQESDSVLGSQLYDKNSQEFSDSFSDTSTENLSWISKSSKRKLYSSPNISTAGNREVQFDDEEAWNESLRNISRTAAADEEDDDTKNDFNETLTPNVFQQGTPAASPAAHLSPPPPPPTTSRLVSRLFPKLRQHPVKEKIKEEQESKLQAASQAPLGDGVQAKALREKLSQLENEIERFQSENSSLEKLRKEREEGLKNLRKEIASFEKEKAEELQKIKDYKEQEIKKLKQERKMFEKHQKAVRSVPGKEQRHGIELLKTQLTDLQEEMKQKESRWVANTNRLRHRIEQLEEENKELREDINFMELKRLDWLRKKQAESKTPRNNSQRKVIADTISMTDSDEERNPTKDNARNRNGVLLSNSKGITNGPKLQGSGQLEGSKQVRSSIPEDMPRLSSALAIPQDASICSDVGPETEDSTQTSRKMVRFQLDRSAFDKDDVYEETQLSDGKVERVFKNGAREILFLNGTRKEISSDGKSIVVSFFNGDIKQMMADQKVIYYYAETQTTHATYPDGLEILQFVNGQIEKHYPNGTKEITFPDQTIKYLFPSGAEESIFTDGTVIKVDANGNKTLDFPNGQREIHTADFKRREYPDGTQKTIYPDGKQETRYSNGRIRIKNKEGNVILDKQS